MQRVDDMTGTPIPPLSAAQREQWRKDTERALMETMAQVERLTQECRDARGRDHELQTRCDELLAAVARVGMVLEQQRGRSFRARLSWLVFGR